MAVKKKDMDEGRGILEIFSKNQKFNQEHNTYLNTIKNLSQAYKSIDPKISLNNLNTKVKSFIKFAKLIKNNNSFQPLLEQLKLQLIEKIKLSLNEFIHTKFILDYTLTIPELLYQLLDQLKEFEEFDKLLNQLKLLDNQSNLAYYNNQIQSYINIILGKYKEYVENVFIRNPNIIVLEELYNQVQNYINKYSEFIKSMTNNRKRSINNLFHTIIETLNIISDRISTKKSIISLNANHISNEMKRRINLLYEKNENIHNNLQTMQYELYKKYQQNYKIPELKKLSEI